MIPFETYARIDAAREHAELAEAHLWYMLKIDDDSTLLGRTRYLDTLAAWQQTLSVWGALWTRQKEIAVTRLAQWAVER